MTRIAIAMTFVGGLLWPAVALANMLLSPEDQLEAAGYFQHMFLGAFGAVAVLMLAALTGLWVLRRSSMADRDRANRTRT